MVRRSAAAALGVILLSAAPAAAEEGGGLDNLTLMGWSLNNVRVGLRVGPDYMGSNDYRVQPSGAIIFMRRGAQPGYAAPDDGLTIGLNRDKTLTAGLSARLRSGRDDKHDLRGFEKIDWAVEAGGFVNWWPTDWIRIRGEVRHGFGGHDSWVADLGADAIWRNRSGSWVVSAGPRLSWADEDFTRTYFGVTPIEAAASPFGIRPYAPEGSTVAAGLLLNAERRVNRRWSITAFGNYRRLMGDAADSPIVVDLGSRDQFSATLGVRYWFGQ